MLTDEKLIRSKDLLVPPDKDVKLKDYSTKYEGKGLNKKDSALLLENGRKDLAEIQDKLYAHNRYSVLIIFQAMDAACPIFAGRIPVSYTHLTLPTNREV